MNEKIAKWCGFKIFYDETWDTEHKNPMFIPSGKPKRTHMIDAVMLPDFQNDFNACLQWVVPELNKRGYMIDIVIYLDLSYLICIHDPEFNNLYEGDGQSLPAAFCNALLKLIKEEK
jgi:hypothetical protein